MLPEARKLLGDILAAADAIVEFTTGRTFDDLANGRLLRAGIYYEFIIVGEALSRLRNFDQSLADRISEARRIVGFRNQIIHGYAKIDDEITWRIVQDKIPVLKNELTGLLNQVN